MSFDQDRYDREVIRPLRNRRTALPADLFVRYAVRPDFTRQQLAERLRQVRAFWNQGANRPGNRGEVCKRFISADEELQRQHGDAVNDLAWWKAHADQQAERLQPVFKQLVADLRASRGATSLITRTQLTQLQETQSELRLDQVAAAVTSAGLTVVDVVELPDSSGLGTVAYRQLCRGLTELELATVPHLLHPGLGSAFRILGGFHVPEHPRLRLDADTLRTRIRSAEATADSPHTRTRKSVLAVLRTAVEAGADLSTISLFHVVDELRAHGSKLGEAFLLRRATQLGLVSDEAALLTVSLAATPAPADAVAGLAEIRSLLAAGELSSARNALTFMAGSTSDHELATTLVCDAQTKFDALVARAKQAAQAGMESDAERFLARAEEINSADDSVTMLRARLSSPAPRDVTVTSADTQLTLSWRAPLSSAAAIRYRVLRRSDTPPVNERDGELICETTDTIVTDQNVPIAHDLRYAVFASMDGRPWSMACHAATTLLPPLSNVALTTETHQVTGSWTAIPALATVWVRRRTDRPPTGPQDGLEILVTGAGNFFVDTAVELGIEYHYALTAVYRDPTGRYRPAQSVLLTTTPHETVGPVTDLTTQASRIHGRTVVRLRWTDPAVQVRLRCSTSPSRWSSGDIVGVDEVEGYGREAHGKRQLDAGRTTMDHEAPAGRVVYTPFSVHGTRATVGVPAAVEFIDPADTLRCRRDGDLAVLSWVWPDSGGLAEVTIGGTRARLITRAQYREEGCCRIRTDPEGGAVEVRLLGENGPSGSARSLPAKVTVPPRAVTLTYRVHRPAVRPLTRRRRITIQADADCPHLTLSIVLVPGNVLPAEAADGRIVTREQLALTADQPYTFEIMLPAGMHRPYWICCRVHEPGRIAVALPPIPEVKVT